MAAAAVPPVSISELPPAGESPADPEDSIQSQTISNPTKIIFHETQFFPLQRQSNIYGLLNICVNDSNKLVVSTLRGEIFCLEYYNPSVPRPPSLLPITFHYIPGGEPPTMTYPPTPIHTCSHTHTHTHTHS